MPKVAFKTLGCRLNQAETDKMAEDLMGLGFSVVAEDERPDVVIVNTCTVTQEASRGSRKMARGATEKNPESLVVVAGCYAVAEPDEAASINGVGMVVTNDQKETIADLLAEKMGISRRPLLQIGRLPSTGPSPGLDRTRVNLKVQTGCDEFCSFCIIPYTRGALRSYPLEKLLSEARRKVEEGARELVLTGVHLGKYGWDQGAPDDGLVALLEGLLEIDELARLRLSSILSRHLTPRIVGIIASEPRVCRHLHVPLQSGDDEVLERMNRPYRIGDYLEAIDRVCSSVPEVGITTDVIVGFPGETEEQFTRTLHVVERVGYLKLHVFRYSPRPGTPSASFSLQVPEEEKKRRSKEAIAAGNRLRIAFHRRGVGREAEVLVEEAFDGGSLVGHTDNFVKVRFCGPKSLVGRLARVRVEEASVESVSGSLVGEIPWEAAEPRS